MSPSESFPDASEKSAEEPKPEEGEGFNPRIEPSEFPAKGLGFSPSMIEPENIGALAPEDNLSPFSPELQIDLIHPRYPEDPSEFIPQPDPIFASFTHPQPEPPQRIPHIGHLCILATLGFFGFASAIVLVFAAVLGHLFGVSSMTRAATEVHYMLGTEAILYLVTFALSLFIFPLFWNKSFFEGIQYRAATVLRLWWQLPLIALGCLALAVLDETLIPGPEKAPIDDIFRTPGAAWLLFVFGVTIAPFFEEIIFRGFLLPALATACDWLSELVTHQPPPPLDMNGHPNWSMPAMVIASILTSLPFALMHAEQTAHAIGPFFLLVTVSLILCAVRLKTRSLAASTLVHACYNFLIFSLMLIGTSGFRHLDKM